ncbi:hypothetical protein PC9H_008379 [Pleurotus ostreatus]|uniref:Domain of unknown function at the cortex 1 domain-containing protein n=1 Tax=Pleurotus ostreatus TaxID=5322 RepID=A0A8H7DT17_PLEOS|nr:uncharacterized protein PC9H_008379 [Pleurotus ostreatus]KAF7426016.1 hypothetical protein PC9H_008379 [Pleurotus ostreatus]KAJ8693429.1 hypothetical protein PTI98_008423 [Pleurotus ostreatus]
MPRLRVLAGPSPSSLTPITPKVNTNQTHTIRSDAFEGEVVVNIKGLVDENGAVRDSEYFGREDRQGITWSIQVQGRFLTRHSADDILFGNTFDKPLKLPWGSGAALKFMKYMDPVLEHDLSSPTKPWALSPLIATMPHFEHKRLSSDQASLPAFPPIQSIADDVSHVRIASSPPSCLSSRASSASSSSLSSKSSSSLSLASTSSSKSNTSSSSSSSKSSSRSKGKKRRSLSNANLYSASDRRSHFSDVANRQEVEFGPQDLITTDFCYGFLQFSPSLALALPGGLSFDLMRYWDGQPVRFVCCERKGEDGEEPWGRIFWCVVIELAED